MKTLLIIILLAVQKMAISSEMNKKSAATEWWKVAPTSFLPSSPAAIEVAKEKRNKEEGPDHFTNGRHGILSIYFPRSFFLTIPIRTMMLGFCKASRIFLNFGRQTHICSAGYSKNCWPIRCFHKILDVHLAHPLPSVLDLMQCFKSCREKDCSH